LAQLTSDNQRLAGLLSQTTSSPPPSESQFREVLRLRGEVGRLKRILQSMSAGKTAAPMSPEEQIAALKQMYAARVDRLKQWLEDHPSEQIATLKTASDGLWLTAVENMSDDANEDDFKRAASNLRANADGEVLGKLFGALRKYGAANGGQFPTDLSQLLPYLASPIDPAILQRFEIVPASSLISELQPTGDWAITQVAAADPVLDSRDAYGLTDGRHADERTSNRWTYVPNQ
jgi:hypothetical protein